MIVWLQKNVLQNCVASIDTVEATVNDVYRDSFFNKQFEIAINYAILSATIINFNQINGNVFDLLDKTMGKVFKSIESIENCDNKVVAGVLSPEDLNTHSPRSLPLHELKLRSNCVVTLVKDYVIVLDY